MSSQAYFVNTGPAASNFNDIKLGSSLEWFTNLQEFGPDGRSYKSHYSMPSMNTMRCEFHPQNTTNILNQLEALLIFMGHDLGACYNYEACFFHVKGRALFSRYYQAMRILLVGTSQEQGISVSELCQLFYEQARGGATVSGSPESMASISLGNYATRSYGAMHYIFEGFDLGSSAWLQVSTKVAVYSP
jgi:hypothetical protein